MKKIDFIEMKEELNRKVSSMTKSDWAEMIANVMLCAMPAASVRMIASPSRAVHTLGKMIKVSQPLVRTLALRSNSNNQTSKIVIEEV